jgi:dipeptidyl aminopeptidase/acylaminoacyl peptidase
VSSDAAIADRLQGKLLLIHATNDVNTAFATTMKMSEALARADKPYDLVVLPGGDHGFRAGGPHQERYVRATTLRYFREHLGGCSERRSDRLRHRPAEPRNR